MSGGRFFLDTNILVYTFDLTAPGKRGKATALVSEALVSGKGCISLQVAQEFLNVSQRKFAVPMTAAEASRHLKAVLAPLCAVFPSFKLLEDALGLQTQLKYSFTDSLIVAAALEAGCETLFSEDLQHGQQVGRLRIANPFAA
jgi:predicted nucleic acid-binding protein